MNFNKNPIRTDTEGSFDMKYQFQKGGWSEETLTHAYSYRFAETPAFVQGDTWIENPPGTVDGSGYSYISLVSREKFRPGARITAHVAFEELAAPLLVLAKELEEADGVLRYGDYLEVVIWKNGLNVWDLWRQEDGSVKWVKLLGLTMPLETGKIHELKLRTTEGRFEIELNGMPISLQVKQLYSSFHLGVTGCEGPCRIYDMEIETPETGK